MNETEVLENKEETEGDQEENVADPDQQGVFVGPHVLGGIQVITRGLDGTTAVARIDLQEAALLIAHLSALTTMTFQTVYAQQAQAAMEAQSNAQKLYVPRGA